MGISADVADSASIKSAFQRIEKEFAGAGCAAAVFNASGGFVRKPFLETGEEAFKQSMGVSASVCSPTFGLRGWMS